MNVYLNVHINVHMIDNLNVHMNVHVNIDINAYMNVYVNVYQKVHHLHIFMFILICLDEHKVLLFKNKLAQVSLSQSKYLSGGWVDGWRLKQK